MLYRKSKKGLIEPENDYQYKTILAMRKRDEAEQKLYSLESEISKIKQAIGIND